MSVSRRAFLASLSSVALVPRLRLQAATRRNFTPIRRGVGTFEARGGTIGWLISKDAVVAVDSQFPDSASSFLTGIHDQSDRGIDLLVNSHHHGDHTAGNAVLGPASKRIIAHRNVPDLQRAAATRADTLDNQVYATQTYAEAWEESVGDEVLALHHFGPAHTGGDSVIHFQRADVVHMGDLVFNRMPCFIDLDGGASTSGWIEVLEAVYGRFTDDTVFIYGHGNPAYGITGTRDDLLAMRDFLTGLREYVAAGIGAGTPLESLAHVEIVPGFPDHRSESWPDGIPNTVRAVYRELSTE